MGIRFSQNQPNLLNTRLNKADTKGSASSAGSAGSASSASSAGSAATVKPPTIKYEAKTEAFKQPNSKPVGSTNAGSIDSTSEADRCTSAFIKEWQDKKRSAVNGGSAGSGSAALEQCRQDFEAAKQALITKRNAVIADFKEKRDECAAWLAKFEAESGPDDELVISTKQEMADYDARIGRLTNQISIISSLSFDDL